MKILTALGLVAAMSIAHAQATSPTEFVIDAGQVVRALSARGLHVDPVQVFLPARVVASVPNPSLQMLQVSRSGLAQGSAGRWWVKIGCEVSADCVPFYAVIFNEANELGQATAAPGTTNLQQLSAPRTHSYVMRTGDRATLVIDRSRSRIEVAVVAMENGGVGDAIRVASPDHKQFYRAEVVSGTLLKASMAQ